MIRKIGTHTEMVVVKPQKERSTCIYLDKNRICRCEKSPRYTEKCFEATWCTYKTKGDYQPEQKNESHSSGGRQKKIALNDEQRLLKIQLCEIGRIVYHFKFGKGKVISYNENLITILFDVGEKTFHLKTIVYNGYIRLEY